MSKATLLGIPDLIHGLEWVYLLIWIGLGLLAVWLPPNWRSKLGAILLVLIAGGALPVYLSLQIKQEVAEQKPIVEKRNAQLEAAMARFEERCKTAGEKIYRTVENVEGVLLTNVRPKSNTADWADPNWSDAALPDEGNEDWYIRYFLFWEHHEDKRNMRGYLNETPSGLPGYKFVDVQTQEGLARRFRLEKPNSANLTTESLANSKSTRYAVEFENFIDPEDRKLWIAGTKVIVTDTAIKEKIAEKIWYAIDPGQGSTSGFRSPWKLTKKCPLHIGASDGATRLFVDQVLKPKKGE